jgi:hypothetical protein
MEAKIKDYYSFQAIVAALLFCVTAHVWANGVTLYKYFNENGIEVRSSSIPPKYAQNGYEVIDLDGQVLEIVPPAPKAEDVAKAEQQRKTLATYHLLKRRYTSVDEITSAKARRLSDLNTNISILKGNINTITTKIDGLIQDAAGFERQGRQVPDFITAQLAGAKQELKVSEELLAFRTEELEEIKMKFDRDVSAFIEGATLEKRLKGKKAK